ncbi:hypothetical protein [Streptomyces bullii]|uniref:NAD-dependent epimerase/dehydratase domain-containing protein n=1 Tax=Streptomyces bullii TaxID=349910 RepID=A0ABW0V4K9_9ACTN
MGASLLLQQLSGAWEEALKASAEGQKGEYTPLPVMSPSGQRPIADVMVGTWSDGFDRSYIMLGGGDTYPTDICYVHDLIDTIASKLDDVFSKELGDGLHDRDTVVAYAPRKGDDPTFKVTGMRAVQDAYGVWSINIQGDPWGKS